MNFKRTIIALLVFAALISLYIVDSSKKKKDKKADETSSILSQIDGASMTEIKLTRNNTVISFIKDVKNGEWYINDSVEGKIEADKTNLSTLIESLGSIRKTESIGEVRDVEKYGLASPGISISIKGGADTAVYLIGKKTPGEDGIYFMKKGDRNVYISETGLLFAADKSLYDFRDKKMTHIDAAEINAFSITESGKTFDFRKQNERWFLSADRTYPADEEVVTRVLNSITAAQVKEFINSEKREVSASGLDNPSIKLVLKDIKKGETSVFFGNIKKQQTLKTEKGETQTSAPAEAEKIYARCSDFKSDLLVDKSLTSDLLADIKLWKSRKIFEIEFDSINDTRIAGPVKTVAFRRSGKDQSEYEIYEPERLRASHWECNSLNSVIAAAKAEEFIKPTAEVLNKAEFDKPFAVITVKTGKNKLNPDIKDNAVYTLIIGGTTKKDKITGRYAKSSNNTEEVFIVSGETVKELVKTPFDLREKELIHINAEKIESILIKTLMNNKLTEILVEKDDGKWQISEPKVLRDKNVDDILWDILSLKMEGTAVKPVKLSDYAFDRPFAAITLHHAGDKELTFKIGSLIPGDSSSQNYVMVEGDNNIYITSTALRNVISGLISR